MVNMDEVDDIRMSDSPGRSPHVTHEVGSPVRSVHPEFSRNESIDSQADFGQRTFFDDKSSGSDQNDVALPTLPERPANYPGKAFGKQRPSRHYLGGITEHSRSSRTPEQRSPTPPSPLSPTDFEKYQQMTREAIKSGFDSDEDSFVGSVDEMTPSRPVRKSNMLVDGLLHHSSPQNAQEEESPILPKHRDMLVVDRITEVHHSTMQALTGMTGSSNPPPTPPPIPERDKYADWRSSRYHSVSAPARRVTMAPPPINTARDSTTDSKQHVKTPYPFHPLRRKEFGRQFSASDPTLRTPRLNDGILTLSIRRSNPNSRLRLSTLTIPANSEFSAVKDRRRSSEQKHKEYATFDFDDAELFRQLRIHYKLLCGPWRIFSARSLKTICVSGTASRAADAGYGWLLSPRSPRALAYSGLNDTFSEDKLLRFFCNPNAAGKRRYAWVSWAHRLADAPAATTPLPPPSTDSPATAQPRSLASPTSPTSPVNNRFSMIRRLEQHEGLEFVVGWSVKRILIALALMLVLSLAATLLWIFLGVSWGPGAGFRGAGDRVVSGMLIGMSVLMVGCTVVGGWLGVSWLVW